MAITRLWQAGAEFGDIREWSGTTNAGLSATAAEANTGTYSYVGLAQYFYYKNLAASTAQIRAGFFLNHVGVSGLARLISFRTGAATYVAHIAIDSGNVYIYTNGVERDSAALGTLGTTSTWLHVGVDIKIDGAAGWVYLYVNGEEILGYDGVTNQAAASVDEVTFLGGSSSANKWSNWPFIDDIYIDDTVGEGAPAALPNYKFTMLNPDGNGYSSDFNGSDGNQVDNYLLVDEVTPDDDTTYVYHDTASENDGFECEDLSLGPGETVSAVIPVAVARKLDVLGSVNIDIGERLGGVNVVDTPGLTLPVSYGEPLWVRHTTKPGGGAWTEADVNNAEMVIETT